MSETSVLWFTIRHLELKPELLHARGAHEELN